MQKIFEGNTVGSRSVRSTECDTNFTNSHELHEWGLPIRDIRGHSWICDVFRAVRGIDPVETFSMTQIETSPE